MSHNTSAPIRTSQKIFSISFQILIESLSIFLTFALFYKTLFSWIKSLKKKDRILFENNYHDQKILLVALYQSKVLRNDLQKFLKTAKSMGYYIIGINTLHLENPEELKQYFDCYIERYNFGRDFGSYKTGFTYIFSKSYHHRCSRLTMINDSVFYESSRSADFLKDLMDTDVEALGATENLENQFHLGSFCISIVGNLLRHPNFVQFWTSYKRSELRPIVINHGELGLTQCLKRLVSHPDQLHGLYNVKKWIDALEKDPNAIQLGFKLACESGRKPKLNAYEIWLDFLSQHYTSREKANEMLSNIAIVTDINAMEAKFIEKLHIDDPHIKENMISFLKGVLVDAFLKGSQIHTNNELLFCLGLPLVKLDGYFRGTLSAENVLSICHRMDSIEGEELQQLLLNKGFGQKNLRGFNKILYSVGFL